MANQPVSPLSVDISCGRPRRRYRGFHLRKQQASRRVGVYIHVENLGL